MAMLEAFSGKDIRTAKTIIGLMEKHGIPLAELDTQGAVQKQAQTNQPSFSMNAGETEINGLRCICGAAVVNEALCGAEMVKESAIRIACCLECSAQYKVR